LLSISCFSLNLVVTAVLYLLLRVGFLLINSRLPILYVLVSMLQSRGGGKTVHNLPAYPCTRAQKRGTPWLFVKFVRSPLRIALKSVRYSDY